MAKILKFEIEFLNAVPYCISNSCMDMNWINGRIVVDWINDTMVVELEFLHDNWVELWTEDNLFMIR